MTEAGMRKSRSVPLMISSRASSGTSVRGVSRSQSYSLSSASSFQKMSEALYLPKGAMPPLRMLSSGRGMTFSMSMKLICPKPRHFGQAPMGELNEKSWGEGSW